MQVTQLNPWRTAALAALVLAGGCSEEGAWRNPAIAQQAEGRAEAAYLAPPILIAASSAGNGLSLRGAAEPNSRVRLGAPTGEALFAQSDQNGAWSLTLPQSPVVRLYGLSMAVADRTVQSEGYVAILPGGQALRLRAGAGAVPLAPPPSERLRILAVDYDRDGGAVVSGRATPGASLVLRIDGVDAQGKADAEGRFSIAATEPLSERPHQILVAGDGEDRITLRAVRGGPLAAPLRAEREGGGWRIEWMTPGGGAQTTVIPAA